MTSESNLHVIAKSGGILYDEQLHASGTIRYSPIGTFAQTPRYRNPNNLNLRSIGSIDFFLIKNTIGVIAIIITSK